MRLLNPFALRLGLLLTPLMAFVLLIGCSTLDQRQREWIFQPAKQTYWAAKDAADGMEEVWIEFDSLESGKRTKLHGLWYGQPDPQAPVLLYLHGARWDIMGSAFRMRRMHEHGFAVLGVDYRGFGLSTDLLPSEATAYEDARAAWSWLSQNYPHNKRYIFGHSLGGAIAVQLATVVDDAAGLIVEGSFTSVRDVFASLKWGWLPVSALITQRFDAGSRIANVKTPVLIVHGSKDRAIPASLGRALYERAGGPKRFVLVEGGSHHNTNSVGFEQYREALHDFFGLPEPGSLVAGVAE